MGNAPANILQSLTLNDEIIPHCICLAKNTIRHIVTIIDTVALIKHVVCLGCFRIVGTILVNVITHIREQVSAVAGLL
ncbi:hypothetical protein CFIMG_003061RAa [Ceratocystis fimbriata CBS 114723]|uniref:Uncharacterized protein n=1 Tax=Ceratocystis fimbriata CBS 114723 TaxID=1035309 RepID=A0A2C5X0Q8_9PEZI|nr:hypothetical protein CFIMG_003061RAa [Ceratocystis fimbriata CBS 114723]